LKNLAEQLCVYATGRPVGFGDRTEINGIVDRTMKKGGGIRSLVHEVVVSKFFLPIGPPDNADSTANARSMDWTLDTPLPVG